EAMNRTSAMVADDVDEMVLAGLEAAPSRMVRPPRVAASPVALECRYLQTVQLPVKPGFGDNAVMFGEVVGIYIADGVIEDGMVDITSLRTIARCGYHDYTRVDAVFAMKRSGS